MFLDRSRRAPAYPWLEWKVRFFVVGAMLALGGMAMGMNWLVWLALAFLALGVLTRFLPTRKGREVEGGGEGDPLHEGGDDEGQGGGGERDWWTSGS